MLVRVEKRTEANSKIKCQ